MFLVWLRRVTRGHSRVLQVGPIFHFRTIRQTLSDVRRCRRNREAARAYRRVSTSTEGPTTRLSAFPQQYSGIPRCAEVHLRYDPRRSQSTLPGWGLVSRRRGARHSGQRAPVPAISSTHTGPYQISEPCQASLQPLPECLRLEARCGSASVIGGECTRRTPGEEIDVDAERQGEQSLHDPPCQAWVVLTRCSSKAHLALEVGEHRLDHQPDAGLRERLDVRL